MTFTGTWALLRTFVRLDRVRLAVWMGSITLLIWVSAASTMALFPTQADIDRTAATMEDNSAIIALNAAPYGLRTLGGEVVFGIGSFGHVVMGLMGMFLVGRHIRGDEEAGRTELLRATAIGRNAPMVAALANAVGALAITGVLITLVMLAYGLPAGGSVAYGAGMAAFGILFANATVVAGQVTEHNRAAYGIAGAALGASYVIRAVGDIGTGTLSWLSPMGWAQAIKAFAGERWWTLGLLAATAVGLVGVAAWLMAHRDLGSGLVVPRPGPSGAAPGLVRPWGLAVRLQRAALFWWTVGLALTGLSYGAIGKDIRDFIAENDAMADIIAQGTGDLTDTFFATSALTLALVAGGFTVAAVVRLRSEETSGRAEPLLATALPRSTWAGGHLLMAVAGTVVVLAGGGLGMGLAYGVSVGDLGEAGPLLAASVAFAPALWVLAGLALALFGLLPRAATWGAWAALTLCFVISYFGQLFDLPGWVMDLSPFQHVPQMPAEGFDLVPTAVLTLAAALLVAVGLAGLRHRDIATGA
ncbi:MAG TPA: hypothetical protein VFI47_26360 [Acidimicrobiales bacterium]|nr:hypothetical protein [Acidimicrobiales bacterium]